MEWAVYISASIGVILIAAALFMRQLIHGLVTLVLGLCALAVSLLVMGSDIAAALLVVVYAGAILVLVLFVVMLLNINSKATQNDKWPNAVVVPAVLSLVLLAELVHGVLRAPFHTAETSQLSAHDVAHTLFVDYWLLVELASLLLTAAAVAAFHLGRKRAKVEEA